MLRTQCLNRKAKLCQRAWLEILNENIRPGDKRRKQRAVVRAGKIDGDGLLAAVEPDEIGRLALGHSVIAARKIALGPFQFQDTRASVRKARGGEGRGDRLLQRDDKHACKGQRRVSQS